MLHKCSPVLFSTCISIISPFSSAGNRIRSKYYRGSHSHRGIFVMRDQIISFTEKREFKKIPFVIRDPYVPGDT